MMDIRGIAEEYQKYGYYIQKYTSECLYSLISDLTGNLVEVELDNWIFDVPVDFNISSALVGERGTGKSTTIKKFKMNMYNEIVESLSSEFLKTAVSDILSTRTYEGFAPSGEGITHELNGITERVIRIIGIQFSKTMSLMFGNSYLSLLSDVFMKLYDGDSIDRWLSSGNIHIDEGKFTTIMLDIHPDDLDNHSYTEGGLGRRTNLAIFNGKLNIPDISVSEARENRENVKKIDSEVINYLVQRVRSFVRMEGSRKPILKFDDEALKILLKIFHKYGTDSDIAVERYPTVARYAMLEAIINSHVNNIMIVDKECVQRAIVHLYQYKEEQKTISQQLQLSIPKGRVELLVSYVDANSSEKDGQIKWVMHHEIMSKLNFNARQLKEVETEIAQSRKCWVVSVKPTKKKRFRLLARGDIKEIVLKAFLDSESRRMEWEKYEIEGDE